MIIGSAPLLSRYYNVVGKTIAAPAADTLLLSADPHRIWVLFQSVGTTGTIYINPFGPASANSGIALLNSVNPFILTYHESPAIIGREWRCFGGAGFNVTVISVVEVPPGDDYPPLPDMVIPEVNA